MALQFTQKIIHQKAGDFSVVKHLKLSGTNEEIGFKLGEIAKKQHRISRSKNKDVVKNRVQKRYLKTNYPIHYDRMKGMAKAYNEDIEFTGYDFTCFGNPLGIGGCSAVFYPPEVTESQTGILSRNLDLPTVSFQEIITGQKSTDVPAVSRIYVVEMEPDKGFSSLVNLSFELYGLGLDGMNSEGLTVTHLYADAVNQDSYRPALEYGVGINEMLVVQMLLDNCRNVEDAKALLLANKHFYMLLPTHLLIADRFGASFAWEYSPQHNKEFIINRNSDVQIITNFLLHEYPDMDAFPTGNDKSCPFERYKTINDEIRKTSVFSKEKIKRINARVFIRDAMYEEKPPITVRTIYHNLYDTHHKSMDISFYRKDEGGEQLRTEYFTFRLG